FENLNYKEPCVGGGSIILNKVPSITETVYDLNPKLIELWEVVKEDYSVLYQNLLPIQYTEENFRKALNGEFWSPVNTYIKYRFSRSGLCKDFAWSTRTRGGRPGDENAYLTSLTQLK